MQANVMGAKVKSSIFKVFYKRLSAQFSYFLNNFYCSLIIIFVDRIRNFDGCQRQIIGPNATLGIFVLWPQQYLSIPGYIFDHFCGTALLCFCTTIITDSGNRIPKVAQPFFVALTVILIGLAASLN
ncbi:unnamed protein product [Thelazia callipaeda]|uniref:SLC26A/SulP transporter domain-containing protein n=1 Tax=Thelazia callipaeda TaxID=103827 RepID=A0A0N5D7P7_THECL|nr:unnamed protein product [Thelazia callipaeda]